MLFPHTVTFYHHTLENGADVYTKTVVGDVYLYGTKTLAASGKGTESVDTVTVIASPETTAQFEKAWRVCKGDLLLPGAGGDISLRRDLDESEVMTVTGIAVNICGSSVDNVQITAK